MFTQCVLGGTICIIFLGGPFRKQDLQLSEEDLARLRELVPPGARAMVPEGLRAKSGGGTAANATRASHLRETLGAVGSNRAAQEPTLAKAALRATAVATMGSALLIAARGEVGGKSVPHSADVDGSEERSVLVDGLPALRAALRELIPGASLRF